MIHPKDPKISAPVSSQPAPEPKGAKPKPKAEKNVDQIEVSSGSSAGHALDLDALKKALPLKRPVNDAALQGIEQFISLLDSLQHRRMKVEDKREQAIVEIFQKNPDENLHAFVSRVVGQFESLKVVNGKYCSELYSQCAQLHGNMLGQLIPPYSKATDAVRSLPLMTDLERILKRELISLKRSVSMYQGILEGIGPLAMAVKSGYAEGIEGGKDVDHLESVFLAEHEYRDASVPFSPEEHEQARQKAYQQAKFATLKMSHPNVKIVVSDGRKGNIQGLSKDIGSYLSEGYLTEGTAVAEKKMRRWSESWRSKQLNFDPKGYRAERVVDYAEVLGGKAEFKKFLSPDFLVKNNPLSIDSIEDLQDAQYLVDVLVSGSKDVLKLSLMPTQTTLATLLKIFKMNVADARGQLTGMHID